MADVRRMSLRYARCQGGELHDGEMMNLVCVDEKCQQRGIICPVCQMESHDSHFIMPVKAFLDEVKVNFLSSNSSSDLNTLPDYLRSLENTKKELLTNLRQQIVELSAVFKELECAVQEVYLSLRRNVLLQSTVSTKLPSLLTQMSQDMPQDSHYVVQQFKKYCELIKHQDGKLRISDKSKTIVENFSQAPSKLKAQLIAAKSEFTKKAQALTKLTQLQEPESKKEDKPEGCKFSDKNKGSEIELSDEGRRAKGGKDGRMVFLDQPFTKQNQEVTLHIVESGSKDIMIGVCNINELKQLQYQVGGVQFGISDALFMADGTVMLSSGGEGQDEDDEPITEGSGFDFTEKGSKIKVGFVKETKMLSLSQEGKEGKKEWQTQIDLRDDKDWGLCVRLGPGDEVELSQGN